MAQRICMLRAAFGGCALKHACGRRVGYADSSCYPSVGYADSSCYPSVGYADSSCYPSVGYADSSCYPSVGYADSSPKRGAFTGSLYGEPLRGAGLRADRRISLPCCIGNTAMLPRGRAYL